MMRRLYGFVSTHSRAVILAAVVLAAAETAFIAWQHSVQERLLEAVTDQALLPEAVIVTATPVERSPLLWRDRLRIVVASSLYSRDPAAAPFSFEADLVAGFGPFGLTGDLYPLNTTAATAALLVKLAGTHPRLALRYRWNVLSHDLQVTATAQPFDMQFETERPGVGPVSWHLAAAKPLSWKLVLERDGVLRGRLAAPDVTVTLTDPAANIHRLSGRDAELRTLSRMKGGGTERREAGAAWHLAEASLSLEGLSFETGDWQGVLQGSLEKADLRAEQTADVRDEELEGVYRLEAKRLSAWTEGSGASAGRRAAGRDLVLRLTADSVPSELLASLDEYRSGRLLAQAAPMKLSLDELTMRSEARGTSEGPMTRLTGELSARSAREGRQAGAIVDWWLEAEAPGPVVELVGPLLLGSRRDVPDDGLFGLMERRETPRGPVWVYSASGHAEGIGREDPPEEPVPSGPPAVPLAEASAPLPE